MTKSWHVRRHASLEKSCSCRCRSCHSRCCPGMGTGTASIQRWSVAISYMGSGSTTGQMAILLLFGIISGRFPLRLNNGAVPSRCKTASRRGAGASSVVAQTMLLLRLSVEYATALNVSSIVCFAAGIQVALSLTCQNGHST